MGRSVGVRFQRSLGAGGRREQAAAMVESSERGCLAVYPRRLAPRLGWRLHASQGLLLP